MNELKRAWSAAEERLLLDLSARGLSQHEIADHLRRTIISVRSRLAVLRRVKRIATKQRKDAKDEEMTDEKVMRVLPYFEPQRTKSDRWFVSVRTGNGPDSHIGDFATEAEAKDWISIKAQYWPGKPATPR
jgi:hypothetical protein